MVWKLLCTAILLQIVLQKSVCFRIKFKSDDDSDEKSNSTSVIHETRTPQRNTEVDSIKFVDYNNIPEKEPESISNIHLEKSEPKISHENDDSTQSPTEIFRGFGRNPAIRKLIENEDPLLYEKFVNFISQSKDTETQLPKLYSKPADSNIKSENSPKPKMNTDINYSVNQSPADVFKRFGKDPAYRKRIENEDPQVYETINYMKTSQSDIAVKEPVSLHPESSDSEKNYFASDNSKSDNLIKNKLTLTESTKPLRVTSKTNKLQVSASISEASMQSTEEKEESKIINADDVQPPTLTETSKYLNAADLKHMTQSSGKGVAQSIECDLPHLDINSRCFANILEVTVTSRSALLGRISFQEAQGHIDMSGNNANFYAVYGLKTPSGFMWRLQERVTIDDVDVGCKTCHTLDLRMMVLVMEEFKDKNKRCVVDLTCTQLNMPDQPRHGESSEGIQNEMPHDSRTSESDIPRVHAAKTTLNILKGTSIESEVLPQDHVAVGLGTKLGLSISAYTKDITLDLHILNCEARGEDGKGITLIKDGCSAHHAVKEFHEVLGMVHDPEVDDHHIVRVTQHTTFQVFNFSPKPQAIAIVCKIKMCGGECDERPGCVNSEVNLGHRKQKSFTIFYEEVVLGQMLNVAGLPVFRGAPKSLDLLSNIIEPEEESISVMEGDEQTLDLHANCVPRLVFYISLGVLGGLFLLLLVLALYFSKAIVIPKMTSHKLSNDEVESPSRALYHEYSSPRRRSPGSKTPDQQTLLNNIVYS